MEDRIRLCEDPEPGHRILTVFLLEHTSLKTSSHYSLSSDHFISTSRTPYNIGVFSISVETIRYLQMRFLYSSHKQPHIKDKKF